MKMSGELGTASNRAHNLGTQMNKANQHTANMYAQFNDIGVMLAAGQNPLQLALQQGTQINQVIAQMGGGMAAVKGVGVALLNIVNPMNLAVIGMIALGAAAFKAVAGAKKFEGALSDLQDASEAFSKSTKAATYDIHSMVDEYGVFSEQLRTSLMYLAQLDKTSTLEQMRESAESLRKIGINLWNMDADVADYGNLLEIDTLLRGNITTWKSTRREVRGFIDDIETMADETSSLDDMYAAAIRVKEAFAANVDVTAELTNRQERFWRAINDLVVEYERVGATSKKLADDAVTLGGAWTQAYADMRKAASGQYDALVSLIAEYERAAELSAGIVRYGEDSAEYAQMLRDDYARTVLSSQELKNATGSIRDRLFDAAMAAYDMKLRAEEATEQHREQLRLAEEQRKQEQARYEQTLKLIASKDKELESLSLELAINEAILRFGRDSAEVARARRDAYEAAAVAAYEQAGYSEEAADSLLRAKMEVYDLGVAVNKANSSTRELASSADRVASSFERAKNAVAGWNLKDQFGSLSGESFYLGNIYEAAANDPLVKLHNSVASRVATSIVDGAKDGLTEVEHDLGGSLATMLYGGGDGVYFWTNFQFQAIDSWKTALETAFAPGSEGLLAVRDGITGALEAGVRNSLGGLRAMMDGFTQKTYVIGSLLFRQFSQLKFDALSGSSFTSSMFETNYEVIERGFRGLLQGGGKTFVDEYAKILKTVTTSTTKELTKSFSSTGLIGDFDFDLGGTSGSTSSEDGTTTVSSSVLTKTSRNKKITTLMRNVVADVINSVSIYAEALGQSGDELKSIQHQFSLKFGNNADSDKIRKAFEGEIEDYTDKLAKAVLDGAKGMQLAGESWTDTLERIVTDFWGIYGTMELLGAQMFDISAKGASKASKLVQLFGDVDAFNSAAQEYFQVAYSQAEQEAALREYTKNMLRDAGYNGALPQTREQYKALVEAQDLNTKKGREYYHLLVSMAAMFDQILPAYEGGMNDTTKYVLDGLDDLIRQAQQAQRTFEQLAESLAKTAEDIRHGGRSPIVAFEYLRDEFSRLYTKGMTGDLEALQKVGGIATQYADAAMDRVTSAEEYAYLTAVTANKLDELSGAAQAGADLSAYQVENLELLKEQIEEGKITNVLVQEVVDSIGGMSADMWEALGQIYTAQTGKELTATNMASPVTAPMTTEEQANLVAMAIDSASSTLGATTNVSVSSAGRDPVDKLRSDLKKWMKDELRATKEVRKWTMRTYRHLKNETLSVDQV